MSSPFSRPLSIVPTSGRRFHEFWRDRSAANALLQSCLRGSLRSLERLATAGVEPADNRPICLHQRTAALHLIVSMASTRDATASEATAASETEPGSVDATSSVATGTLIGRYLVIDRVGAGGMGTVYAAYDAQLGRRVAIKVLRAEAATNDAQARLLREAQAMARLAHPNVLVVHDVGTFGEQRVHRDGVHRRQGPAGVAPRRAFVEGSPRGPQGGGARARRGSCRRDRPPRLQARERAHRARRASRRRGLRHRAGPRAFDERRRERNRNRERATVCAGVVAGVGAGVVTGRDPRLEPPSRPTLRASSPARRPPGRWGRRLPRRGP